MSNTKESSEQLILFIKTNYDLGLIKSKIILVFENFKDFSKVYEIFEAIQQQMIEVKKIEGANLVKEVKRICKTFGFAPGMLKGSLAKERGDK